MGCIGDFRPLAELNITSWLVRLRFRRHRTFNPTGQDPHAWLDLHPLMIIMLMMLEMVAGVILPVVAHLEYTPRR